MSSLKINRAGYSHLRDWKIRIDMGCSNGQKKIQANLGYVVVYGIGRHGISDRSKCRYGAEGVSMDPV